jgi:RNA polymerase sigma-70 factor (ECF subfamily)
LAWHSTHPSLIERLADPRDAEAWSRFDQLYGPLITNFCRSNDLQLSDAEDIRQTVTAALASSMQSFRYDPERGRFRTYLGRSVRHAIWNHAKRPIAHTGGLDHLEGLSNGAGAAHEAPELDQQWEQEWRRLHLKRAFETLSGEVSATTAQAFRRLLDGVSPQVVAEEVGLSIDAVYKIKQRCGARLRAIVDEQIREEDRETHG